MVIPLSSRRLAEIVGLSERDVEDHINHIIKSVARDRSLRFILEPCECRRCGFAFRDRNKITRPSRCPRCHSEAITEPRYSIERRGAKQE